MKRFISLLLVFVMILCSGVSALAMGRQEGLESLQTQFTYGEGPEVNGYKLDYRYFSPVKENDSVKYPLVVWLHGMGEGAYEGKQVINNNIAYWTSDEFQARFENAGGAFIIAPRSPEEDRMYWEDSLIEVVRATIDAFIAENAENIDITRIYVGGFSMGGKMTLKMAVAYPEMFAAAFPICPAWQPDADYIECLSDMPIWLTSGKLDPLVNYSGSVVPTWNAIVEASNVKDNLRFSTLSKVCYPDGKRTTSSHHSWFAVNYDMFSIENGDYPHMKTVGADGNEIKLIYPNGMISWLSGFTVEYDGTPIEGTGNIDITRKGNTGSLLDNIISAIK